MADTANDVRVVAAAETGIARRRGERGCAPGLDAGRRSRRDRVTPIVLIIGNYFGWPRHLLVWQDLLTIAAP
jgi:hypothetical protein